MLNVGGSPASKVYVGSTPAKAVYVGDTKVWPDAVEEPQELYAVEVEYLPNYEVKFTAKKGFVPADPLEEAFMFRCAEMPRDGYTAREFTKTWAANGYSKLNCTLEDLYGDGNPTGLTKAKISFTIQPRP